MFNVLLDAIDRAGDWLLWQIDHNDFLEGFVFATMFVTIPYPLGIIDIVVR